MWYLVWLNLVVELSSPVLHWKQNVRVLDDHGLYYDVKKVEWNVRVLDDHGLYYDVKKVEWNVRVLDDHGLYYDVKEVALQCPNGRVRHQIAWEMCCSADVCAEGGGETYRALE